MKLLTNNFNPSHFFLNKDKSFWALQISGWIFHYLIMIVLMYILRSGQQILVLNYAVKTCLGFVLTILLRQVYRKVTFDTSSLLKLTLQVIFFSIITSVIWYSSHIYLLLIIYNFPFTVWIKITRVYTIMQQLSIFFTIIISWSGLYFIIKLWNEWDIQKERLNRADILAKSAQLQMLRCQINPHFLFNSLNSIRALMVDDKNNAKAMITELSEFLKYSIITSSNMEVKLATELEVVRYYLSIEKKRFEDKLEIEYSIQPSAEEYPILNFLLHPLIENAIKYGMKTSGMPLKINIFAFIIDSSLHLEIRNTGKWIDSLENSKDTLGGTGTGLDNVRQRLENYYPNRYKFETLEKSGWVIVKIEIDKNDAGRYEKTI